MPTITAKDEIRAALHRLRERDGYPAVEALLAKIGVANVNQVSEDAYEQVMAACPPLPRGQGIMAAAGDKTLSTKDQLDAMALARNTGDKSNEVGDTIKEVIESAPTLQDGLNNAARAIHVRNRAKAKAK
jgi:Ni,Fe-hydrogenase III large subunit